MWSVSLNEAIELNRQGAVGKSFGAVQVADGLCVRFAQSLILTLSGLHRHAKHFGLVPNAAPLDPSNFESTRGQRTARLAGFLSRVLLSQRSRFIHKAATVQELVEDLRQDFCENADELANGCHLNNERLWAALTRCHYDLNTCFRETIVLLKSFLLELPEEQLDSFEITLRLPRTRTVQTGSPFRHRRFAVVPGK